MRANIANYTNDIVGLSVMVLMLVALIAGQAGASQRDEAEAIDAQTLVIDVDFSFRPQGE